MRRLSRLTFHAWRIASFDALVTAQGAADAGGVARRFRWQIKGGTRVGVDRVHVLTRSRELFAQAIATDSYGLGNERGGALAKQASSSS